MEEFCQNGRSSVRYKMQRMPVAALPVGEGIILHLKLRGKGKANSIYGRKKG